MLRKSAARRFGTHPDSSVVEAYVISAHGLTAEVMTHGASLIRLQPEGAGSVVLGFRDYAPYLAQGRNFGAIVGRFANRVSGAQFVLDGERFDLDANFLGRHTLHGGNDGSGQRNWRVEALTQDSITLVDRLPDGHMGFPGNLDVRVRYRISEESTLEIEIEAITDAATPCSFAQHSYFNLTGAADVSDHRLSVEADCFLQLDADQIPTGETVSVSGTRFDFRSPARLGDRMAMGALDNTFCLSPTRAACRPVARLAAPGASHALRLETTEPGLQIYDGAHFGRRGLALEPQGWPDAPNRPGFPEATLRPGQMYHQMTRLILLPETGPNA